MKKFLLSILCVTALVMSFYVILIGRYAYKMHGYSFALPKEVSVLAIGDSQLQAAVNDGIWTECRNISVAHEHYWAILKRLQLYVEVNPQINDVILSVSPRAFSANADARLTEEWYVGDITKSYLPYWSLSEWCTLLKRNLAAVVSNLATPVGFYWNVNPEYIRNLGFFDAVKESHMAEFNAMAYFALSKDEPVEYAKTIAYIHDIVEYCHQHNIRVTLCSTPVYDARQVLPFIDEFYAIIDKEFPDLPFIDLMITDLPPEVFRDNNHLNQTGAEWATAEIERRFCIEQEN